MSSRTPSKSPPFAPSRSPEPSSSNAAAVAPNPKVVSFRRESISRPRSGRSIEVMNEQSPLLRPSGESEERLKVLSPLSGNSDDWTGEEQEETKSSWYLLLLTIAGLGLQIAWSVEMSYGSPYLLSLGLSKSLLALVWIAGPLSGTLVQPYVGVKSDNCRISWGKRRPFIIGGAAATIVSLLILAWTREVVGGFLGLFGADKESHGVQVCIMLFAVLFVYVLDFAINVIQAGIRAFVVDCAPTHQQEAANAWIMRTTGVGNILGYLSGYINLPKYLPFLGNTQMKVLCAIACFVLAVTVAISCSTVHERDPRLEGEPENHESVVHFFKSLYRSVRRLPPQIAQVCKVQFFAWIGWFPFLFYITTYIGEIYVEPYFEENPHMSPKEIDKLWEKGTRVGTFALLIFAITTFASSIFLPMIVAPTFKAPPPTAATPLTPTTPGSLSASGYFSYKPHRHSYRSSTAKKFRNILSSLSPSLRIRNLTLRRAWLLSHILFAALMWCTFIVRSVTLATILVGLVGIPWALTNWAPFALIAADISRRDAIRRGIIRPPPTREGQRSAEDADDEDDLTAGEDEKEDQAGVVLGIHNVAIAAPQVIATLVSSFIFKWLQKPRGTPGDDSVAWVLRFGGLCALVAAYVARGLGELNQDEDEEGGQGRE